MSFRVFSVCCAVVFLFCGTQPLAPAQTSSPPIAFEVATIKPVAAIDWALAGVHVGLTRASYLSMTLQSLFTYAYGVGYFQISGPKWVGTNLYDVVAELPDGASPESDRQRLQTLLGDRFQLRFHVETRDEKVYALLPAKDGTKLKPSTESSSEDSTPLQPGEQIVGQGKEKHRERTTFDTEASVIHNESTKISMPDFARFLTSILRQTGGNDTVVDRTGLRGDYQIALDVPMATAVRSADSSNASASDPGGRVSLKNSLDKLGLRLVKQNSPVDYYVIDHVETPSEN
jgi:uncharacterized protein (TIGR03435 family)